MRILVVTEGLNARGGVYSYLEAVGRELVALGHRVEVAASAVGSPEMLTSLGIDVVPDVREAGTPDGIIAMLDFCALRARAAFPDTPMIAISHGPWFAQDVPPVQASLAAAIALSDPAAERLRRSALSEAGVPIVRLRQPADMRLSVAPGGLPSTPRLAVLGSHRGGPWEQELRDALVAADVMLIQFGGTRQRNSVFDDIRSADIVIGIGRVILEGMIAGRACLVCDANTPPRWLTADSYAEIEAVGFAPHGATPSVAEAVAATLDDYTPEFGRQARALALEHHSPIDHATTLVGLLMDAPPVPHRESAAELRDAAGRREAAYWEVAHHNRGVHEAAAIRHDEIVRLNERVAALQTELYHVYRSRSWKVTRPLRALRRRDG